MKIGEMTVARLDFLKILDEAIEALEMKAASPEVSRLYQLACEMQLELDDVAEDETTGN